MPVTKGLTADGDDVLFVHPASAESAPETAQLRRIWHGAKAMFLAILAGFLLRVIFIYVFPAMDDDSLVYGGIAKNLLLHHAYAIGYPPVSTLIRLPGYPLFLALSFRLFGMENYQAVRWLQLFVDLGSCLLIAATVQDTVSRRAGVIALWMAALCPFTANYVALPMTETLSVFCVALAAFASGRLIDGFRSHRRALLSSTVLMAFAITGAVLLRPDGLLLGIAVVGAFLYSTRGCDWRWRSLVVLCLSFLVAAALAPWAMRNYRRFGVLQPLAPRYANDPGEWVPYGFLAWNRTWELDYVSSPEVFWNFGSDWVDMQDLPERAFDSPYQLHATAKLVADYDATCSPKQDDCHATRTLDDRFGDLAVQRTRQHPFRSWLLLPTLRLLDMWCRPRVEYLPVPLHWWNWRSSLGGSLFASGYLAANGGLLILAASAFVRRLVRPAFLPLAYLLCRCVLLANLSNCETRYTLECYPFVLAAAATAVASLFSPRCDRHWDRVERTEADRTQPLRRPGWKLALTETNTLSRNREYRCVSTVAAAAALGHAPRNPWRRIAT